MWLKLLTINQNIKKERILNNLPNQMDEKEKLGCMRYLKGGERTPMVAALMNEWELEGKMKKEEGGRVWRDDMNQSV